METIWIVVIVLALAYIVLVILRPGMRVIRSPTLGLYNLSGDDFAALLDADRKAIAQLFPSVIESSDVPPVCTVLFLYCHIEPDGSIRGSNRRLREIIRDSGAPIVVVASENPVDNYVAASQNTGYGLANLIMTLERHGDIFPNFFQRLFTLMKRAVSMPVAWNKLAPQIPGREHVNCPSTFGVFDVGQITFK